MVSPSWGGPGHLPQRYQRALHALRGLGYDVRAMPHAEGRSHGTRDWLSASIDERVSDIHSAFADDDVDMVLASIGGDHSAQLLQSLDFDLIASHPKPFCGYSDITVLLHAIHARTGMITFYGPALLPEFGEVGGPDPEVVRHWQTVLGNSVPAGPIPRTDWQAVESRGESDLANRPRSRTPGEPRTVLRPGTAAGALLPACLPSMRHLIGTPWQPRYDGGILVIEPPEAPYDAELADADLAHLRAAGILDELAGLGVGRTEGWPERQLRQFHESVLDACRDFDYPIITGLECTHSAPLMTFPVGGQAKISDDELVLTEAAVA